MTTVVMIQREDEVEIGWDSQMTRNNLRMQLAQPKVVESQGIIYAISGIFRALDVISTTQFPDYDGSDARGWIITNWVPALKASLSDREPYLLDDDGCIAGFNLLMVVDGTVFHIDGALSPTQTVGGRYAIGSGADFAFGALAAGADLEGALDAAGRCDLYTGGVMTVTTASDLLIAGDG